VGVLKALRSIILFGLVDLILCWFSLHFHFILFLALSLV